MMNYITDAKERLQQLFRFYTNSTNQNFGSGFGISGVSNFHRGKDITQKKKYRMATDRSYLFIAENRDLVLYNSKAVLNQVFTFEFDDGTFLFPVTCQRIYMYMILRNVTT